MRQGALNAESYEAWTNLGVNDQVMATETLLDLHQAKILPYTRSICIIVMPDYVQRRENM